MATFKSYLLAKLKKIMDHYAGQENPCSYTVSRLGHCYRVLWQIQNGSAIDVKPDRAVHVMRSGVLDFIRRLRSDDRGVKRCRNTTCDGCHGFDSKEMLRMVRDNALTRRSLSLDRFNEGDYSSRC